MAFLYNDTTITALSPVLWIDFSDAATVTTVGGNVSQVNDKSGSGYNFTQGSSTLRPAYVTGVQNGRNIARFDGTDDRLTVGTTTLFRSIGGATTYIVRRFAALPTEARTLFAIARNLASSARASYNSGLVSGKASIGGRRLDSDGFQFITGTSDVSTTEFRISNAIFDYANSDLDFNVNKTQEASTTSFQTNGNTSNTNSVITAIGSATTAAQYFQGDIGEILVFHTAHNQFQRDAVNNYLGFKWGLFTLQVI